MNFMDGDNKFQIILYLIIVVGGILANAYRSIVKKKEDERRKREHAEVDFPDFDNDTHNEPEVEVSYEYEPINVPETGILEEKSFLEDPESDFEESISALIETKEDSITIEAEPGNGPLNNGQANLMDSRIKEENWSFDSDEDELKSFDLKKAIIYSEIINAKYI